MKVATSPRPKFQMKDITQETDALISRSDKFKTLQEHILIGNFNLLRNSLNSVKINQALFDEILFELLQQQFLELYDSSRGDDCARQILQLLIALKRVCNEEKFLSLCMILKREQIQSHEEFLNWTVFRGRLMCSKRVIELIDSVSPSSIISNSNLMESIDESLDRRTLSMSIADVFPEFSGTPSTRSLNMTAVLPKKCCVFSQKKEQDLQDQKNSDKKFNSATLKQKTDSPHSSEDSIMPYIKDSSDLILEETIAVQSKLLIDKCRPVRTCSFSENGKSLVFGCNDGSLTVFSTEAISSIWSDTKIDPDHGDNEKYLCLSKYHPDSIYCSAWNADSQLLATGSKDRTVKICKISTVEQNICDQSMKCVLLHGHTGPVRSVSFSPNKSSSSLICSAGSGDYICRFWDARHSDSPIGLFKGHKGSINSVHVLQDDELIVSGGEDSFIYFWDRRVSSTTMQIFTGESEITALAPLPGREDTYVLSSHRSGTVAMYDVRKSVKLVNLVSHTSECRALKCSSDGNTAVSGGFDGIVNLYRNIQFSLHTHRVEKRYSFRSSDSSILSLDWSAASEMMVTTTIEGHVSVHRGQELAHIF